MNQEMLTVGAKFELRLPDADRSCQKTWTLPPEHAYEVFVEGFARNTEEVRLPRSFHFQTEGSARTVHELGGATKHDR